MRRSPRYSGEVAGGTGDDRINAETFARARAARPAPAPAPAEADRIAAENEAYRRALIDSMVARREADDRARRRAELRSASDAQLEAVRRHCEKLGILSLNLDIVAEIERRRAPLWKRALRSLHGAR